MNLTKTILASALALALGACGSGSSTANSTSSSTAPSSYALNGQAQKGPLIFGSRIWVSELDLNLNPNGKTYLAQTKDDLGNFTVSSTIGSSLVELLGVGYYMDELTGNLSTSTITLSAIADLSIKDTPTINVLTTLQAPRVKNLILQGKTYSEALAQSQREVLAAFGIDSAKITSLGSLYAMSIAGNSDQDSVLLATSAILSKMSTNAAATNGSSQAAEMSYYLSRIASDIANTGTLNSTAILNARNTASSQINLAAVRSNVETYYANRGVSMTAPKFEEWIDKDNSGVLPRRLLPLTNISFTDLINVEHSQLVTSNAVSVSGAGEGKDVAASVISNGSIVKNNSLIAGSYTTAKDGDSIAIRLTSLGFGQTITSRISLGSTEATWSVSTRTPIIESVSNVGCGAAGYPGDNAAKYHAFPITVDHSYVAKYAAAQMQGSGSSSLRIYSDNSGVPGTELLRSSSRGTYFAGATLPVRSGGTKSDFNGGHHYYLGSDGISLASGTTYWIVLEFASASDPGALKHSAVPAGYHRKVSSDGSSWSNYAGQASCRYDDQVPEVWLSN